ncbi:MAG: isoleucine--tRNA ligase [bacterium]
MFKPVSRKVDFPGQETEVLEFWKSQRIFERSLEQRKDAPEYVFYDGPPFATGLPHFGHLLAGTIKDIVPRYQTMRGHLVNRRFGWDCHGLPVEYEVEQDLKLSGKRDIETLGVDVFNERCRSIVLRYTREWRDVVNRMGRWVDFDHDYKTMDPAYMESIWWVFKALWEKDLVYEGHRIVPYCPRCTTPLSNFETNQGYADVQDPAVTIRFKVEGAEHLYVLAWTTTPWTLPSNVALAVGKDIRYVKIKDGDDFYYLAQDRVPTYYKKGAKFEVIEEVTGAALIGLRYEPLFPYFSHYKANGAFRVIAGDFVSTEDGTGVVHIAPGFGEDDSRVGKTEKLPAPCPVDEEGRFTADIPDYVGRAVKEADADIIKRLKQEGKLIHQAVINHSYPHCWRCDTPLIYRAISAWYVKVESMRDQILKANSQTRWVPEHLRDGRFGKWLEQARDWNISRNRYWGTPLPIWRSDDGKEVICVGSVSELEALTGQKVSDLHKHFVDKLEIPSREGRGMLKRIPEVLDCWFESGAMPYAQAHYPFEHRQQFESHFPADFIAEGLDQTRGWFYTLTVLSTALFDRPAFRNVIVNGLVLAEDGRKMSKRLKNYPDPGYIINTYGADALRLYLINSPVVRAEDLRFSEAGVQELLRNLLIPLWNAYGFFVTYANVDGWTPGTGGQSISTNGQAENLLDRWIRSSMESLSANVTKAMDNYDLQGSVRPFVRFIEDLTNWYIRRSRRRFWKSQDDADKAQAYETLYYVLLNLSKIAAPFVPFVSDALYRNLRTAEMPESVHLCDFPVGDASRRDPALERQMEAVMTVVALGRTLRSAHDLKVRQPLKKLHVACRNPELLGNIADLKDIILEELNVKEAEFRVSESDFATIKTKANFARLGPKLGPLMKKAAGVVAALKAEQIERLASGESLAVLLDGKSVELTKDDVIIEHLPREGSVVAAEGGIVVALDTALTPELVAEGMAREFVSKLQNMRKIADLEVTQRIRVQFFGPDEVKAAVLGHLDYITLETLSLSCEAVTVRPDDATDWDLNGHPCAITFEPA